MDAQIVILENQSQLERAFPLMKELRPHLNLAQFLDVYKKSHESTGYNIAALMQGERMLAIMGYRILFDYVHGKHCYIDDLVSTESERSKGHGAKLLKFAEDFAREEQCSGLRLCTGTENDRGKNFYEKNGWNLRAIVYKKKI